MQWNQDSALKFAYGRPRSTSSVSQIYPGLKKHNLFQQNSSVLSIGSGTGELEIELMKEYQVQLSVVDPSKKLVNIFKQFLNDNRLEKNIIEIVEDVFQGYNTTYRYDLILAIHSWHYLGYDEAALRKALSLLKPEGVICFVATSEKAFTKELKDLIHPNHAFINYEEISRWLDELGCSHRSHYVEKLMPLTRYIKGNDFTEYCKNLICFLSRKEWSDFDNHIKDAAKSIILKYSENATIDDAWGIVVLPKGPL